MKTNTDIHCTVRIAGRLLKTGNGWQRTIPTVSVMGQGKTWWMVVSPTLWTTYKHGPFESMEQADEAVIRWAQTQ